MIQINYFGLISAKCAMDGNSAYDYDQTFLVAFMAKWLYNKIYRWKFSKITNRFIEEVHS